MSFVHLHVHSEYSLLDGFSNIRKLVRRAAELDMPALALTDHGTMFGAISFYNAARKEGIKPIIGVEAYLAARKMENRDPKLDKRSTHLLLLAENETGYRNLLKLASAAQLKGFYYYPRVDHEFLAAHSEGLICTSGCMSAEIPRAILNGEMEKARRKLDWYYEVFGPDRFYVELQHHDIPKLHEMNRKLVSLGERYQARYVATNDVHYVDPEEARLQDILLAIQTSCVLTDPHRMRMTDDSYYLRQAEEMAALFQEVPQAITNTLEIAERCELDLGFKGYRLPEFEVPAGSTPASHLRKLCEEGLVRRYGPRADEPEVRERLEYELRVIHEMGFDTYFLIVADLCQFARQENIWYNARGSAAGSIVAYTLDITMVDPLEHGLIFERFLNPGRISMPDIDLDFRDDMRHKMLEYCAHKYGEDKVAQIITFGTMKARAAVRDVGRVLDIPLTEVDRIAKHIPNIPGKPVSIDEALEKVPDLQKAYKSSDYIQELIDTARGMEGVVRNAGTHAAGVIITDRPIVEYVPLHRPTSGAAEDSPIKTVTQFEMEVLDALGLLKVDFLGLATLTIMARACSLIEKRHGVKYDLDNIPVDDPATFELLGRGETAGVFQVEGSGMRRNLVQMKPRNLDHVVAMVALFRPGPMEFIPTYIQRMHGQEEISYRHDALAEIFEETYGIPVYQEQIMRAAVDLAGYTASEADGLRKAIAKKIREKLVQHRQKFVEGAVENGISQETANRIFSDWEEFARYGFNKCLPGDVEVLDGSTGRLIRVEDVYHRQASLEKTVSLNTEQLKLVQSPVRRVFDNGVQPVFRLKTALGRQIEATANHPFFTYDGWQILDHLRIGQHIAVPRSIPVEGHQVWSEHEVIALGHLLAEGNLCHPHSVYFYSRDRRQIDDYIRAAEQFDNVQCKVARHRDTFSVYARRIERKAVPGIVTWAKRLRIWGKNARQKEIPAEVFELNNRQIGLLISRMWQGDGHINLEGKSLYYATASERMARQLQHLLLRLGIISRLREVIFPYKDGRTGFQVFVTGSWNFQAFAEHIAVHFIDPSREEAVQRLAEVEQTGVGTKDIIPIDVKHLVRAAKDRRGLTRTQFNARTGIAQREFYPSSSATKAGFSRQVIQRSADYFEDHELRALAESDIYWDQIVSIESVGMKRTYDLEVPGTHNFIANDIIVHNSHAVDYGVIAVQTAYLKAHYPVEYMTALLSVAKNDTDKVAFYVADCRRMGIEVLPPDVNASGWDFTIEDQPDGESAIRFGLGAVKNVGQGAVEVILEANRRGPFEDISDFARRVDLRHVGRRALECLIKVGALSRFGSRTTLLEALDQIHAISASHFRAKETGQLSMFGPQTGLVSRINLPEPSYEISRREQLNWEKELIGLYVSDHPLKPYLKELDRTVSHYSSQLSGCGHRERVRVAGLVASVRPHVTKTGKPMGFVRLEDLQGVIELVVFPRTWETYGELLAYDNVVLVSGQVDSRGSDPKILVDTVSREFDLVDSADSSPPERNGAARTAPPRPAQAAPDNPQTAAEPAPRPTPESAPTAAEGDMPPPPDTFPDDWGEPPSDPSRTGEAPGGARGRRVREEAALGVAESAKPAKLLEAENGEGDAAFAPAGGEKEPPSPRKDQEKHDADPERTAGQAGDSGDLATPQAETPAIPPPNLPPIQSGAAVEPGVDVQGEEPRKMLTIILRATGDKTRDILHLRRIHGTLISYPGADRFAFYMVEAGRSYVLEFPNFTTGICDSLMTRLQELVGTECVKVDELTFQ